jgi:hypothetical protein
MMSSIKTTAALVLAAALAGIVAPVHGQSKPAAGDTTLSAPKGALTGNVQQVMRGIIFPNANMIFNVQSHDPADKKPLSGSAPGGSDFNWVQWGQGLYSGWDDVDYAAIALAEVSPMLLTPGRTCENGKPVPVDKADWIQFTDGMLQAAKKTLEASTKKNMDAVSDSTNDLNDSCQNCHRIYRGATRCVAPTTP